MAPSHPASQADRPNPVSLRLPELLQLRPPRSAWHSAAVARWAAVARAPDPALDARAAATAGEHGGHCTAHARQAQARARAPCASVGTG